MAGQELPTAEGKVRTFYDDLANEVDSHFAKALSIASARERGSRSSSPQSPMETRNLHEGQGLGDSEDSSDDMQPASVTSTQCPPLHTCPSDLHPPPATPISSIPSPILPVPQLPPNNRGRIIYPEFANYLVHPEVDPYHDLPKLPGQTDSPPSHVVTRQTAWIAGPEMTLQSSIPCSVNPLHSSISSAPHHSTNPLSHWTPAENTFPLQARTRPSSDREPAAGIGLSMEELQEILGV